MFGRSRPIDEIPIDELVRSQVWEFDLEHESSPGQDETWVRPVKKLPVRNLDNRVVITDVMLANGTSVTAMLGNVELNSPRLNEQFLVISVHRLGEWFHLARYQDVDYARNGPQALAEFLGLSVEKVFPIYYDISGFANGLNEVVKGRIPAEPRERLTEEERMRLIIHGE